MSVVVAVDVSRELQCYFCFIIGGAQAQLFAANLVADGLVSAENIHVYTFGSNRVGDQVFAYNYDRVSLELINLSVSLKTSHWFIFSSQPVILKKTDRIYHFKSITQGCKGKTLRLHWENKIRCRLRPVILATNERQACFVSYFCSIHRCYRI